MTRVRHLPFLYPPYFGLLALRVVARVPGVTASWRYDVTWLEPGLCGGWPTLERLLNKPTVLDVDDAVEHYSRSVATRKLAEIFKRIR